MLTLCNQSTLLQMVRYEDVIGYLRVTGWERRTSDNQRWYIFTLEFPEASQQLEIVLPSQSDVPDMQMHLTGAISAIAAIRNEPVEKAVQTIACYERDIWSVRNLETGQYHSIMLTRGINQLQNINRVIKAAGSSEERALPYFNRDFKKGKDMANHFRMGHTFPGSFGLTIESHIVGSEIIYHQISLFDSDDEPVGPIAPIERRVMERIARGLLFTQQATYEMDIQPLIKNYGSGFAANACAALAAIGNSPVECYIQWSPKIKPAEDVREISSVRLDETSFILLREANKELRNIQPETKTIKGTVTHLTSKENPLDPDAQRSIIIRWKPLDSPHATQVSLSLPSEEYQEALNAHRDNRLVEVTGTLIRIGQRWRLDDPQGFKIIA